MALVIYCSSCWQSLKVPDDAAGKTVRCPACQALTTVPERTDSVSSAPESSAGQDALENEPAELSSDAASVESPSTELAAGSLAPPVDDESGDAFDRLEQSRQAGPAGWRCLAFVLVLGPLAWSMVQEKDDVRQRLEVTIEHQPAVKARLENDKNADLEKLMDLLPDHKIEGALLSRDTWLHWGFAGMAAIGFLAAVWILFPTGNARMNELIKVGLVTATGGILFLLAVQWVAEFTQGWNIHGRSIIVLFFYIVKFIGFSYRAALDPRNGFLLSFLGYTFGVGLCEELTKILPLLRHYCGRATLDWRGACAWGLACGVGFGVAEGIMYSSDYYNGLSGGSIYVVRFVSCVGLHAIWAASTSIMVWRRKEFLEGGWDWATMATNLFWILLVPMVLHGLYDTLLKQEQEAWALAAALASFAWLIAVIQWTRYQERQFWATA